MAEPVNLNRFCKEKAQAAKKTRASQNVLLHGRPKTAKELDQARQEKADRDLDGKKTDR